VRGVRGLRGQVRVEVLTDDPEGRFGVGAVLFPEGSASSLTVAESSAVADGPGWWLLFREVRDRSGAEALKDVYLEAADTGTREAGTWLWSDIVGLTARTTDGRELGVVTDVYRTGGAEVYTVGRGRGELDIPAVRGVIVELDPPRGVLVVDAEALALDEVAEPDPDAARPPRPPAPRRPRRRERRARRAATDAASIQESPPAKPPTNEPS
jgi:16S rRNA processing protein RimM